MRKGASCIPLSQWESETHKRTQPLQPSPRLPRSPPPVPSLPSAPPLERQHYWKRNSPEKEGPEEAAPERAQGLPPPPLQAAERARRAPPSPLSFPGEPQGWGGRGSPSARRSRRRPRLTRRAPEPAVAAARPARGGPPPTPQPHGGLRRKAPPRPRAPPRCPLLAYLLALLAPGRGEGTGRVAVAASYRSHRGEPGGRRVRGERQLQASMDYSLEHRLSRLYRDQAGNCSEPSRWRPALTPAGQPSASCCCHYREGAAGLEGCCSPAGPSTGAPARCDPWQP